MRVSSAAPAQGRLSLDSARTIQLGRRLVRRICDDRSYPSGHDLLHLPRLPHRADPFWLGPDRGALGSVVERTLSSQYHSGTRSWCPSSLGCAKDLRDQEGFCRQRVSGQALRRTLVRRQAVLRPAFARGRCPLDRQHADPAAAATARSTAEPRAAAIGPAPGRGRGCRAGADQASAVTASTAEGDQAQGEGSMKAWVRAGQAQLRRGQ